MLDNVFMMEVISTMEDPVLFGAFLFVDPKKTHLQPIGHDCGVDAIRSMQDYGEDWSAKVFHRKLTIFYDRVRRHPIFVLTNV